jgi:hypothetical protein
LPFVETQLQRDTAVSWRRYSVLNDGGAKFTGSHVAYVDYDKDKLHAALEAGAAIHPTVKNAGELFHT